MLSVVVPSYRRNEDLVRCLDAIRENSSQCEILVPHPEVDSVLSSICSRSGALEYIDGSRVDGVRMRSLWSVINDGIARAHNRYVAWLNDDCIVLPGWDAIGESYFTESVGLVVLKTKGINQVNEYRTIEAAFGIPCANYAIVDKDSDVRFDESFGWFYGDADISLQMELKRRLRVVATREPCVDHLHRVDESRVTNEGDPRTTQDEMRFRKKWGTYSRIGGRVVDFRWPLLARAVRKINRMMNNAK